jgi:hypothetical protein
LAHVLPHSGPYCIARGRFVVGKDGKKQLTFHHYAAIDILSAAAAAKNLDNQRHETYFALGSLIDAKPQAKKEGYFAVSREGSNIHSLRSFFLDLDVSPGKHASQRDALAALIAFTTICKLPKPTITSSGGGLHIYWTVEDDVPREDWIPYAQSLKALTVQHQLINDTGLVANTACVLRVVGTNNWKDPANPREVKVLHMGTPTPNAQFFAVLGLRTVQSAAPLVIPGTPLPIAASNTDRYAEEPISPVALLDNCQALRYVANPFNQMSSLLPEPAWWMGVTFSASMTPADGKMYAHAISCHDRRYNEADLDKRIGQLRERRIGPPPCAKIEEAFQFHANAKCCDGCPSQGKIKSPAVLAHRALPAPPIVLTPATATAPAVFVPDPPWPYRRSQKGIVVETISKDQVKEEVVICPYDMYPVRMCFDTKTGIGENTIWRVKLPNEGWVDMAIPYTHRNALVVALKQRGVHIDESELPAFLKFMTAYTRHLQHASPRERSYSRLGFFPAKGIRPRSFVLGDRAYLADGTVEPHAMPNSLVAATDDGIYSVGDYDEWRRLIAIYCNPRMEPYRVYIYTGFGSILYHMTTFTATAVCAVGETGRGKSTLLDAVASIWGDPSVLRAHGGPSGFTLAGAEGKAHGLFHLPMLLDDVTEQEAKEISAFIFNYSGGRGKIRSQAGGGVRPDTPRWENILLLTGNEDEYARMAGTRVDSRQHTMRLIQIEFNDITMSKADGDALRAGLLVNFGWAGHIFAEYVVRNYDAVKRRVEQCIRDTDSKIRALSEERYWTAWLACAQVAAEICVEMQILPGFPVTHDVRWMEDQIVHMRLSSVAHSRNPNEALSEFLDTYVPNTLTLSTVSGNINNVAREPRGELLIRHEIDTGMLFISAHAFQEYCLKKHINLNAVFTTLVKSGAIVERSARRMLGADTQFDKGNRVRCFIIDTNKLAGSLPVPTPTTLAPAPAAAKPQSTLQAAVAQWKAAGKP